MSNEIAILPGDTFYDTRDNANELLGVTVLSASAHQVTFTYQSGEGWPVEEETLPLAKFRAQYPIRDELVAAHLRAEMR